MHVNQTHILTGLLGYNFNLAKSSFSINYPYITHYGRGETDIERLKDKPKVYIKDGKVTDGKFMDISSISKNVSGEGLIYVKQSTGENPGDFVITVSPPIDSDFKKKRSTKKTSIRKKRSATKTPKRKKRSTKKTPKRNPRRV